MSPRLKFGFLTLMASTMVLLMVVGLLSVGNENLRSQVVAQGVQPGDGLTATYYGNTSFTNPLLIRVDEQIDFDFGFGSPAPEVPIDFFAGRWTGQIRAEQTGTYTFYVTNDDGAVLKIDNQTIINDPNQHQAITNQGVFEMTAGERYDIQLDFFEVGGVAVIKLEYEGPQTPRQIIPARVLYSKVTQCSDKVDNDGDGLIDAGQDPGCEDASDDDERDANCADGIDNDGDGKIDFPEDPGCDSSSDGDETDPITNVNVNLNTGTDTTTGDTTYPLGIQANAPNDIFVKARVGNRFEMVRMNATLLPSFEGTVKTASIHSYLLRGTDSEGKEHLAVVKGRYWDPNTFADANVTSDPWFSFFASGGDIETCANEMSARFSAVPFYLDNPFFFQQMIEMLSFCQRGASGATPTTPTPSTTNTTGSAAVSGPTGTTGTVASPTLGTTLANPVLTAVSPATLSADFSLAQGAGQMHAVELVDVADVTLPTTSCLEYEVQTTNMDTRIGIDLLFDSGTLLSDSGTLDLDGIPVDPTSRLATLSLNQFHQRVIPLSSFANQTVTGYHITAKFNGGGSQVAEFKDIKITDCIGNTLQQIYLVDQPNVQVYDTTDSSNTVTLTAQP